MLKGKGFKAVWSMPSGRRFEYYPHIDKLAICVPMIGTWFVSWTTVERLIAVLGQPTWY
jgi:hypothetical protein